MGKLLLCDISLLRKGNGKRNEEKWGELVQWLEHRNHNPNVVGSTPALASFLFCFQFTSKEENFSHPSSSFFSVFFWFVWIQKFWIHRDKASDHNTEKAEALKKDGNSWYVRTDLFRLAFAYGIGLVFICLCMLLWLKEIGVHIWAHSLLSFFLSSFFPFLFLQCFREDKSRKKTFQKEKKYKAKEGEKKLHSSHRRIHRRMWSTNVSG